MLACSPRYAEPSKSNHCPGRAVLLISLQRTSDLCMANRSIRLCRKESIDGTSGGDLKAPAVSDLPTWNMLWKMLRKKRQDRRRLTKQKEVGEALWWADQQLARGLSCRWLPPIHPSAIRLTCTHQPSNLFTSCCPPSR